MPEHPPLGELLRVDQHPGRQQEERNEQDAADELDLLHEAAPRRDEAIEREPGEERSDDSLDSRPRRDERRAGKRDEDPEEPRAAVLADAGEDPARDPGQDERAHGREHDEADDDLEQEDRRAASRSRPIRRRPRAPTARACRS